MRSLAAPVDLIPSSAVATERVLGWDLLRGMAALAVAAYHLLHWQGVASLHSFGSYGVYIFFILSGASLAYSYAGRLEGRNFSYSRFLWVRYMRLAPLYLALMVLVLPWKLAHQGASGELLFNLALNASFLFGLFDPATSAMLVGGWSLGIEAIFYCFFPVLLWASLRPRAGWIVFLLLLVLQIGWIVSTVGSTSGYTAESVRYHQAPAFAAYFMGGCLLGIARRSGRAPRVRSVPGGLLLLAGFAALLVLSPARAGEELLGWRGAALMTLSFGLVWLAGNLHLDRAKARIALHLGDATYGLYLLHPVIYFGCSFVLLPRLGIADPARWPLVWQLLFAAVVAAVAFVLALASERHLERPLRDWSRSARRQPAPGSVAAL